MTEDEAKYTALPLDSAHVPTRAGVFEIPWEWYIKIKALNNSLLKHLQRSPLHLKTEAEAPPADASLAMNIGSALDLAIFEPERFFIEIVPDLEENKNSKAYKEWRAGIAPGRIVLAKKHIQDVFQMVAHMKAKTTAANLLKEGYPQRVVLWKNPEFGFWCKARLDWITRDRVVVDLKKSQDASQWGFMRSIWRYQYYWQAYWYLEGLTAATGVTHTRFNWLVWEDQPPYEGNIFEADPAEIEKAGDRIYPLLVKYKECLDSGSWPGYPDEIVFLGEAPMFDSVGLEPDNLPF